MNITFYENKSDPKVLTKELTEISTDTCSLLEKTNVFQPLILFKSSFPLNANYCYITELKRYYYINSQDLHYNGMAYFSLYCDVLMSYKDDILNSLAQCVQNQNFNRYTEGIYTIDVRPTFNKIEFKNPFSETKTNVLITVRG